MKKIRRRDPMAPWTVVDEHVVYAADPFLRLTRQHVVLPDGRHIRDYHQIVFPDYVTVIARTPDGKYVLLRKYNHGYRRTCMLFPGGIRSAAESPRRAAARELLEETGYAARRWCCLGHFRPHSNYGCGQVHFYLGEDCRRVAKPDSGDLEAMDIRLLSHDALRRYLRGGRNPSLSCAAAFSRACELLKLPGALTPRPAKKVRP
jgi:ADP-ribose pyrophosphatase